MLKGTVVHVETLGEKCTLCINVSSTKILIENNFLSVRPETGPLLYVFIGTTRRSCHLQGKGSTFFFQLFTHLKYWFGPGIELMTSALQSSALLTMLRLLSKA